MIKNKKKNINFFLKKAMIQTQELNETTDYVSKKNISQEERISIEKFFEEYPISTTLRDWYSLVGTDVNFVLELKDLKEFNLFNLFTDLYWEFFSLKDIIRDVNLNCNYFDIAYQYIGYKYTKLLSYSKKAKRCFIRFEKIDTVHPNARMTYYDYAHVISDKFEQIPFFDFNILL